MELNLDLVIATPDHTVDMKSGLTTMQGISDAVRIITETVTTNKVPNKNTSRSSIRTRLKENFDGSYGQVFSVQAFDDGARKQLNIIGKDTLAEIISYYLAEAFYQEFDKPSPLAQAIIDTLGNKSISLIRTLRKQTIVDNIHNIANNFGYDVKVRYRKSKNKITELQTFNEDTYAKMAAVESNNVVDLIVSITRFNTYTGNGRLQIKGKKDTIAFGFNGYTTVNLATKKLFSRNLDDNNGVFEDDEKSYLKLKVSFLQKKDGDIVKYLVREAETVKYPTREAHV